MGIPARVSLGTMKLREQILTDLRELGKISDGAEAKAIAGAVEAVQAGEFDSDIDELAQSPASVSESSDLILSLYKMRKS